MKFIIAVLIMGLPVLSLADQRQVIKGEEPFPVVVQSFSVPKTAYISATIEIDKNLAPEYGSCVILRSSSYTNHNTVIQTIGYSGRYIPQEECDFERDLNDPSTFVSDFSFHVENKRNVMFLLPKGLKVKVLKAQTILKK